MKFGQVIELYVEDMRATGRMNSPRTETSYRAALEQHREDVTNRDPRYIGRDDVKRTLARWRHPNTQRNKRAILVSFYDWLMEEGFRKDNPARQTRRPKSRPAKVYRLTRDEAVSMLHAAKGLREKRAIYIGICAGLRSQELRGLQGRHFRRDGWLWVSEDIAKGSRERWVPIVSDLAEVASEIREAVGQEEYVLPAQRWRDPGTNEQKVDKRLHPCSPQAIYYLVLRVGRRAGISAPIHPHLLRHSYGDHIARHAGMRNAQFLLGHAGISTTETYVGKPTLDELRAAVRGFTFGGEGARTFDPPATQGAIALAAVSGRVPVQSSVRFAERILGHLWQSQVLREAARAL